MGKVLAFPTRIEAAEAPDCRSCMNARFGGPLTFCVVTGESVVDEVATARHCEVFIPMDQE